MTSPNEKSSSKPKGIIQLQAEWIEELEKCLRECVEALTPFSNPKKTTYGARIIQEECYPKAKQAITKAEELLRRGK